MRDTHIFSLTSVNTASQSPATIRICTIVHKSPLAEEALSAEGLDIDSDTVAWLYCRDFRSNLFHDTHHLMSHSYTRHGTRDTTVLDMQVAAADA